MIKRDLLRTGDIILQKTHFNLFKPVTWFSYLIRIFTKSHINHVSEVIYIGEQCYIIHALGGGITIEPFKKRYNKKYKRDLYVIRNVNKVFDESHVTKLLFHINVKYDYLGIAKIFLRIVTGFWNKTSVLKSQKARWCSEFSAWSHDIDGWENYLPRDFRNNKEYDRIITCKKS